VALKLTSSDTKQIKSNIEKEHEIYSRKFNKLEYVNRRKSEKKASSKQ